MTKYAVCLWLLLLTYYPAASQQTASAGDIEQLIENKKTAEAARMLDHTLNSFFVSHNIDTLPVYINAVGKLAISKSSVDGGINAVQLFVKKIKSYAPTLTTLKRMANEAAFFYADNDRDKLAYETFLEAYNYTKRVPDVKPEQLAKLEMNIGTYAQRMGDMTLSLNYSRRSLNTYLSSRKPDYEKLYMAYNNVGSGMYNISKMDSALYYFNMALTMLKRLEPNADNLYYRPAVLNNNLSGIYGIQGNTTEAIRAMKITINNLKLFLASKGDNPKKKTAIAFQFQAMDNLGGIYKELGDLQQAKGLLEYSYEHKKKNLDANNPDIFKSQIILGQLYYAMHDFDKAESMLRTGLESIAKSDGDYMYWQADACNALALLYDEQGKKAEAARYYELGDEWYAKSLSGAYDNTYLQFLRDAALFYAVNGQVEKGIAKAKKSYQYALKAQGKETLVSFYELVNLAEVYYSAGKYKEALGYSNKSLAVVNKLVRTSDNLLDSIKTELQKPRAILLRTKANYELTPKKDSIYLQKLLTELNESLTILDRRKTILSDPENTAVLLADNAELLSFIKKITLDLYKLTGNDKYIGQVLGLHESALYTRIRSRLDNNDAIRFANVPVSVTQKEQLLNAAIGNALKGAGSHDEQTLKYFSAIDARNQYREQLRTTYPDYYNMRYASIFKSMNAYHQSIPARTSVVYYFFADKQLYAMVADEQQATIVSLNSDSLSQQIISLSKQGTDVSKMSATLHALYLQLWAPVAGLVHNKKVLIIPDGILYSLNFELLTPTKIQSFKELATHSLVAKHSISYHYSLFVLGHHKAPASMQDGFIAYAPGFSDDLKKNYQAHLKDAQSADRAYLSLLPQPFTVGLATRMKDLFGGNALLNEASTEDAFKHNAGHHKIIHIGTHAESDNLYPQYSRLIFAQDPEQQSEDHSLFLPEIYNCDLTSNLTVLTACESGKAGYKDGEGMISLAHAFNYAGSESMLTGLWKIDEQASTTIMESFYKNILDGMDKDEALRAAKLAYINTSDTRMQAPQYWAGLVLMGDTSPIQLTRKAAFNWWWLAGGLFLCGGAGFAISQKKKRNSSRDALLAANSTT